MKNLGFVCLVLLLAGLAAAPARAAQELSPFTLVQRIGKPHKEYFHLLSTPFGRYTIRHDGFVEIYGGGKKNNFHLKASPKNKIEWVYFYEYEGELLLLYRSGEAGYLVRLDQKTRKIKSTRVVNHDFEPPVIREKSVIFSDGTIVRLT